MKPSVTVSGRGHRRRGVAKIAWVAGLVIVVGGVASIALSGGKPESSRSNVGKADRAVVKKTSFDISTTASGALEAKNETILRSKLETRSTIVELVSEGSFVKKGDVLIKLNSDEIEKQIDSVALEVESAKSELVAAKNGVEIQLIENESELRKANLKVELARLSLKQWEEGEHKQKLMDLDVDIKTSRRDLDRLDDKYKRSQSLYTSDFLSKDEMEQDGINLQNAEAKFKKAELAQLTYDAYEKPKNEKQKRSDLDEAVAELDRVGKNAEMDLSIKTAAASNRQQQLSKREQKLAELREQFENSTIIAPADGMVVYATSMERFRRWDQSGKLQIGQEINPNQELIILPDTSVMIASVKVHESLAGRVHEGMPAIIKVQAANAQTFSGHVDSKSIMADDGGWWDQTRQYSVKIAIDAEQSSGLKPADNCEATIVLGDVEDSLTVPIQAVFNDGPVRFVYGQSGGRFTRIPVKLGRTSDTLAEIEKGVNDGQVVLLREPIGGELIAEPWKRESLELAGYKVGEDGQPIPEAGPRRPGGEGAMARGQGGGGRRGGGRGQGAGGAAPGGGGGQPVVMKAGEGAVVVKDGEAKADEHAAGDAVAKKDDDKAHDKPGEKPAEKSAEGAKPADAKPSADKTTPGTQPASGTPTTTGQH